VIYSCITIVPPCQTHGKVHNRSGTWYVSVVSITFYCSMPILYNFRIFLATFDMIYWTNLLIQCPVPVLVCCMFFVSQKIHIKQSPNVIKIYGELFRNICDFLGVGITANGGPHPPQDTWARPRAQVHRGGLCSPRMSVGALLRAQGSLYPEKNRVKISAQSELRISRNIRNGFWSDLGNAKHKRTEREIQPRRGDNPQV